MLENAEKEVKKEVVLEENLIKEIWRRIKKRDFSGNEGLAIKNSIYQFSTNLVMKIGSLIFTIIVARMLLPELFGLYNLALSTILLFFAVSNIGIGPTLVKYVSGEIGKKNPRKAKAYISYLWKVKIFAVIISILILFISAKFISDVYYKKPLFFALLAGSLYIIFYGIVTFFDYVLQSVNYFKGILYKETIFQILRVIFVPLVVFLTLKYSLSRQFVLFYIFLTISASYLIISVFMFFISMKKAKYLKAKKTNLKKIQKKQVNKFLFAVSAITFSGLFFEYIDKIMLGHFVLSEFIGYYAAAIGIVGALSSLEGFGAVLLPIFSRASKKTIETGLKKSERLVLIGSIFLIFLSFLLAPIIVKTVYGSEYSQAINLLRFFSLLLIPIPLTNIYSSYFMSIGKPGIMAKMIIFSTIINIILNYTLITFLIKYGDMAALFGAATATLISQFFYLGGLLITKRKLMKKSV